MPQMLTFFNKQFIPKGESCIKSYFPNLQETAELRHAAHGRSQLLIGQRVEAHVHAPTAGLGENQVLEVGSVAAVSDVLPVQPHVPELAHQEVLLALARASGENQVARVRAAVQQNVERSQADATGTGVDERGGLFVVEAADEERIIACGIDA